MDDLHGEHLGRRTFLAAAAAGVGSVAAGAAAAKGADPDNLKAGKEDRAVAACTYWVHGFGGDDPKATAEAMREAGFDVVVAGGEKTIAAVGEAGMTSWLCGGAFGLGQYKDDSHKAVDITGKPQVWFGSGSPNSPAIRAQNLKSYESMAKTPGIKGILVDGCRFASPASGVGPFFTDFSEHSEKKAQELDFDFARMKRHVQALYTVVTAKPHGDGIPWAEWAEAPVGAMEWLTAHPGVLDWLRFRRVCSTEHFRDVSEVIHGADLEMGVYIFTPSFAPLVGQSYGDLSEFVDLFAPMIYRNYPDRPGPACLNWELTILPEELGFEGTPQEAEAVGLVLTLTGLADVVPDRTIKDVRAGLPPKAVGHETRLARLLAGPKRKLAPIIYIDDPRMAESAEEVRKNGADGLNFFVYKDEWRRMVEPGIV